MHRIVRSRSWTDLQCSRVIIDSELFSPIDISPIISINDKNSAPSSINNLATLQKTKIKNKTECTAFLRLTTINDDSMVKDEVHKKVEYLCLWKSALLAKNEWAATGMQRDELGLVP